MRKYLAPLTLSLVLMASIASAAEKGCAEATPVLTVKEANELLHDVGEVKSVEPSPVNGLWLVELERDGRHGKAFLDYDKKNLIVGTVFPLSSAAQLASAKSGGETPPRQPLAGKIDLAAIPLTDSIVMGNPKGSKKMIVFTDPECPYCAKLHGELKKLVSLEPDLAIYLKMFPLPSHPASYPKARVILGAKSLEMLEKAYAGGELPPPGERDPKLPVSETLRLGRSLGVDATPTIILPDGELLKGALDSARLHSLVTPEAKR